MPRPTSYTKEIAQEICDAISTSSIGIRRLCKQHKHWPDGATIFRWRQNNSAFRDQYAQAKKCQVEVLVDEILEIADDSSHDETHDKQGNAKANSEYINRSRLRVDTRKWLASKLAPKIYGDKSDHDVNLKAQEIKATDEVIAARKSYEDSFKKEY